MRHCCCQKKVLWGLQVAPSACTANFTSGQVSILAGTSLYHVERFICHLTAPLRAASNLPALINLNVWRPSTAQNGLKQFKIIPLNAKGRNA